MVRRGDDLVALYQLRGRPACIGRGCGPSMSLFAGVSAAESYGDTSSADRTLGVTAARSVLTANFRPPIKC
jgi:hypothetical protein